MSVSERKEPEIGDFTSVVGGNGPWQRTIFIVVVLVGLPSAWHTLIMPFYAPDIDHWCAKPTEYSNLSNVLWRLYGIPSDPEKKSSYPNRCQMYEKVNFSDVLLDYQRNENSSIEERPLVSCQKWEYKDSVFTNTIVSQWDLVCDDAWKVSTVNSLFMAGCLTSVILFGHMSDKFGRKPVMMIAIVIVIIAGITCAFSTSYMMFAVTRYFLALGSDAVIVIGYIILVEMVDTNHRSVYGMAVNFGWCTGYVLLPLIAYLLKDWFWIQIATTLPCIGFLSMWWLVSESPRWLLANKKIDKARTILEDVAKKNNVPLRDIDEFLKKVDSMNIQKEKKKSGNFLDLFRTPGLWQKTLNLVFCWFVNSFVYYGLSFAAGDLAGNLFINFALSGAVEFPAYVICLFVIKRLGRRIPLSVTLLAGGLSCLITIFLTGDLVWITVPLAMFGKFCVTASYSIVYVYTAEIFPTVVRNTGVGTCSLAARMGSILAPFVKELGRATHSAVPLVCYGGLTVISGLLILLLPETNKCEIPDTLEEAADFGRRNKKKTCSSGERIKSTKTILNMCFKNNNRNDNYIHPTAVTMEIPVCKSVSDNSFGLPPDCDTQTKCSELQSNL